jgi:pyruvate formate lyase activating enzyme
MMVKGVIFNIQRFSVNDGPGIRTTIFLKGCPLSCGWCHNPEGRQFEPSAINGNEIGSELTTGELFTEIGKDRIFYEESGGGVTFSGGEPLAQPEFLEEMLTRCRDNGFHSAIDTSGYADKALFKKILPITDLFLFDIKLADPVCHLRYTGVSNTEILGNLKFVLKSKVKVIIRIPMVPGITATNENIASIIEILTKTGGSPEVNLLPFHRIAEKKYMRFGIKNIMNGVKSLQETDLEQFRMLFETSGFNAKIGG